VDEINYTARKAWKALHFVIRALKRGNMNTTSLTYMSAKFATLSNAYESYTLTHRRTVALMCTPKTYSGEWAWKANGARLHRPCHLSRVDNAR
jgi:hypothetical protein